MALISLLIGPAMLGWQVIQWLQTAYWPEWTAEDLVRLTGYHTEWRGMSQILRDTPAWATVLAASVIAVWLTLREWGNNNRTK